MSIDNERERYKNYNLDDRILESGVCNFSKQLIMFDDFSEDTLDTNYWFPFYLPQWSSRSASMPSYRLENRTEV